MGFDGGPIGPPFFSDGVSIGIGVSDPIHLPRRAPGRSKWSPLFLPMILVALVGGAYWLKTRPKPAVSPTPLYF